jgi:integrase
MMTGVNPATSASVPRGRASKETHAYELRVAQQIIAVLKEPESTIVAVAAFAGLRLGEILGLTWENYSGATLNVTQNAYRGTLVAPKTRASQDAVPVIPSLRSKLDLCRPRCGNPTSGLMFPGGSNAPLDPSNLDRTIRRELKKAGIPWLRFHAFRRGVATNLHDAGVNDLTIQRVLRHSDPSTTRRSYIKRLPQQATDAMSKMQSQIDAATDSARVQ